MIYECVVVIKEVKLQPMFVVCILLSSVLCSLLSLWLVNIGSLNYGHDISAFCFTSSRHI